MVIYLAALTSKGEKMHSEIEAFDPAGETQWLKLVTREIVGESLLPSDPFPTCHRKRHFPWPVVEGRGLDHPGGRWQMTDVSREDKRHIWKPCFLLGIVIYITIVSSRRTAQERNKTNQVCPKYSPWEATV